MSLGHDAQIILNRALQSVLPDAAVKKALDELELPPKVYVLSAGKASWSMAKAAREILRERVHEGLIITKYGHAEGEIPGFKIIEAGHPLPDEKSLEAGRKALEMADRMAEGDCMLLLLSGGASALMEETALSLDELQAITTQLLESGADIVEMNTIRKRLSNIKGGKLALRAVPGRIAAIVLSDIIGDPLDMIASGPAYPDNRTTAEAEAIIHKYGINLVQKAQCLLQQETPKRLDNVTTRITGSVRELCSAAAAVCIELGYEVRFLTDALTCEAREAGSFFGSIARSHVTDGRKIAYVAGGETVVHVKGKGKGGRNQELALACAQKIAALDKVFFLSVGSDGTDGPTDAAGAWVDGTTAQKLRTKGIDIDTVLRENDTYPALKAIDALIMTGPTGTNVNDLQLLLIG